MISAGDKVQVWAFGQWCFGTVVEPSPRENGARVVFTTRRGRELTRTFTSTNIRTDVGVQS